MSKTIQPGAAQAQGDMPPLPEPFPPFQPTFPPMMMVRVKGFSLLEGVKGTLRADGEVAAIRERGMQGKDGDVLVAKYRAAMDTSKRDPTYARYSSELDKRISEQGQSEMAKLLVGEMKLTPKDPLYHVLGMSTPTPEMILELSRPQTQG